MSQHAVVAALSDAHIPSLALLRNMAGSLDKLVDDVVIQIIKALSVHAVLSLRKTSRRYYLLSKLRCVWYARFCAEVLARNLPLPGPSHRISLLSAVELERRTLRALYLEHAWPRLSANTLVSRQDGGVRVDQVVFLLGGTEILTVHGDKIGHWHIVGWPGFSQELKLVGEWTPLKGVPCRIVKDGDVPGVFAVGPREIWRPHLFAKVVSTTLEAPFVILRDYACVHGVVAGVWRHLLLLDTARGLQLFDWHAQTTGTALLSRFCLLGRYLDFVVFSNHILVVWERSAGVFSIPDVPADGQVVVEQKRVYLFQEVVCRPIAFTTCEARCSLPLHLNPGGDLYRNMDLDEDWCQNRQKTRCTSPTLGASLTLTIVARLRRRPDTMTMQMFISLAEDEDHEEAAAVYANAFPYRLMCLPSHALWMSWQGGRGVDNRTYTALCLGWSGRGVYVVGGELRLVSPGLLVIPPCEMQFGPVFETGKALYLVGGHGRRNSDQMHVNGNEDPEDGADEANAGVDKVDFDEGMGRFVVVNELGGFEVVQLD